jgi:hypothetical protein
VGLAGTLIRCAECGAKSDQLATGWRAFLVEEGDYEPEFEESRIVLLCPRCAEREFNTLGWKDPGEPPPSAMA